MHPLGPAASSSGTSTAGKRPAPDPLSTVIGLPPRKRPVPCQDQFKHSGRHFGRALHAFVNVSLLLSSGVTTMADVLNGAIVEEDLNEEQRVRHRVFTEALDFMPDLKRGLEAGTYNARDIIHMGDQIQAGAAAARADDIKSLKPAILDWITNSEEGLAPPIPRNNMTRRGWNHDATGRKLCPAGLSYDDVKHKLRNKELIVTGDQWPIFIYANETFDPNNPWQGLFRGRLLLNGFNHIFNSPSSVDNIGRSTRAGNAQIHGMREVTPASIAYVAMLVRFVLGSATCFSRKDTVSDSERFYLTVYQFLTNPLERQNVGELLQWWNRQVFPNNITAHFVPAETSALARLLALRTRAT
ncbi:hypothetical protein C8Q76DRAFT_694848 [Earliella scabrosa]|nr:hypothetical protein C8Q76DRAFT_694848 [Earliella scabrosa]